MLDNRMSRNFILCFAEFAVLVLLGTGCATSPPKDLVRFDALEHCPGWNDEQLEENVNRFDDATDTVALQCALDRLRHAKECRIEENAAAAKLCFLLADRTEADQTRREHLAAEGIGWAERALAQGGEARGDVYYYLAVNLGIAVERHPITALKSLDRLVATLDKAVALAPDVHNAGPCRVLGMVYLKAPPWPQGIGDGDKSLELLQEAVRRSPGYPLNRIFHARALWEVEGEEAGREIAANLEEALRLMNGESWRPVRERWLDDVYGVAREAHVDLPFK
jgi:hypothetical protein